jgi:hypothetical protein
MRTVTPVNELEARAVEALTAVLGDVSVIKLREIQHKTPRRGCAAEIVAHVDVFGHSHLLACDVKPYASPRSLRAALRQLHQEVAQRASGATPVLIAPYLSAEAQELCKESKAGFIDLEGNARLSLGDVFIAKRSMPRTSIGQQPASGITSSRSIRPDEVHAALTA